MIFSYLLSVHYVSWNVKTGTKNIFIRGKKMDFGLEYKRKEDFSRVLLIHNFSGATTLGKELVT